MASPLVKVGEVETGSVVVASTNANSFVGSPVVAMKKTRRSRVTGRFALAPGARALLSASAVLMARAAAWLVGTPSVVMR